MRKENYGSPFSEGWTSRFYYDIRDGSHHYQLTKEDYAHLSPDAYTEATVDGKKAFRNTRTNTLIYAQESSDNVSFQMGFQCSTWIRVIRWMTVNPSSNWDSKRRPVFCPSATTVTRNII